MHRRRILQWTGLAAGAAILPPVFYNLKLSQAAARAKAESRKLLPLPQPTGVSKIVLVYTSDRVYGTHRLFELLQPDGIKGKSVFLKPNFNTADPAPSATDPRLLEALVQELQNAGARTITVGDRSGMANTRDVMQSKGVFSLAAKYKFKTIVFDDMPISQWQYFGPEGTHWKQGFAFARPVLDAEAVVTTGCLKTHRGALYTLSLKNTVGMVAKKVPGDKFNYMWQDLHGSPHMQQMIAEINAVYQPRLILMDGVETFVDGGPASGKKVSANVMLAGTDRIAIDIVALGILRSLGTTSKISQGSVWNLEQIRRAGELGVGIRSPEQIELIAPDQESQKIADKIRPLIAA